MESTETLCGPECGHEIKLEWDDGPWKSEPDRVDFHHAGFACLLHRSRIGSWCGYVGVPPEHPAFLEHYDAVEVDVHGGLTYSEKCYPPICHIPDPGEPADLWWFGFDCAHLGDLAPGMMDNLKLVGLAHQVPSHYATDTYRTERYARNQTKHLAEQLAAMKR